MELETISSQDNPLLDRVEIHFRVQHPEERTPRRGDIRTALVELMDAAKERIIVDHMRSEFGKSETVGYAKVYKKQEIAQRVEREHILRRNHLKKIGKPTKKKKKRRR